MFYYVQIILYLLQVFHLLFNQRKLWILQLVYSLDFLFYKFHQAGKYND
jgi:hypothetical protein